MWQLGTRVRILGARARAGFPVHGWRHRSPFLFACLHPHPAPLRVLRCHPFLAPLFLEAKQPVCSQAQHTLSQPELPLKLQCVITTSCSRLLAASSANKHPDALGARDAAACSWQPLGLLRKCPHPSRMRGRPFPSPSARGFPLV